MYFGGLDKYYYLLIISQAIIIFDRKIIFALFLSSAMFYLVNSRYILVTGEPFDDGFAELQQREEAWWASLVDEQLHKNCVELSGKLVLFLQIVKLAEQLGDKVYVS